MGQDGIELYNVRPHFVPINLQHYRWLLLHKNYIDFNYSCSLSPSIIKSRDFILSINLPVINFQYCKNIENKLNTVTIIISRIRMYVHMSALGTLK